MTVNKAALIRCFLIGLGASGVAWYAAPQHVTPLIVIPIVLACTACALQAGLRRVLSAGAALFGLVAVLAVLTPVLRPVLRHYPLSEAPRSSDVIVVLGAGVVCSNGQLDDVSLARLERGLELWELGYAPVMTLSAQAEALFGPECPTIASAARQVIQRRYPTGGPRTLVLGGVMNTFDEAERFAALARRHRWQSALLVTSPLHSRRAVAAFHDAAGIPVFSVPSEEKGFDVRLRTTRDRSEALRALLREVLGGLAAGFQ